MGKSNKLRQARRLQTASGVCAVLEAHSRRKIDRAGAVSFDDFNVRESGIIVQCRGFANRSPCANEDAMIERWAREHGLRLPGPLSA